MSNARAGSGGKLVVGLARQTVVGVAARFAVGVGRRARVTCSLLQKPPVFALGARVGGGAGVTVGVVTGQFARAVIQRVTGIARRARVGVCALFTVRVLGLTGVGSIQMIWDAIVIIVVRRISEHLLFAGVLWSFYLFIVCFWARGGREEPARE